LSRLSNCSLSKSFLGLLAVFPSPMSVHLTFSYDLLWSSRRLQHLLYDKRSLLSPAVCLTCRRRSVWV
jgi:hypothetical protein